MSSSHHNLSQSPNDSIPHLQKAKVGIVVATWNHEITFAMRDACVETLKNHGLNTADLIVVDVPGAFELPLGAKILLSNQNMDAVICIGCVIKGETKHDEYISNSVANGIMALSVSSGKPIIFGVLTPNDQQQALDRAGGKYGNKGIEAAHTALKMIHLSRSVHEMDKKKIGF